MDDKERRRLKNDDIIKRLKRGESLSSVPAEMTWYPPRPLTIKNKEDIAKVYNLASEDKKPLRRLTLVNNGGDSQLPPPKGEGL